MAFHHHDFMRSVESTTLEVGTRQFQREEVVEMKDAVLQVLKWGRWIINSSETDSDDTA